MADTGVPLFDWLASQLASEQLRVIAAADYGYRADEKVRHLERLASGDLSILRPLNFEVREVLELTRWTVLPDAEPAVHVPRLFACCALLIAAIDESNQGRTPSISPTLAIAVDSVVRAFPKRRAEFLTLIEWLSSRGSTLELDAMLFDVARLVVMAHEGLDPRRLTDAMTAWEQAAVALSEHHLTAASWFRLAQDGFRGELWTSLLQEAIGLLRSRPENAQLVAQLSSFVTAPALG